MLTCSKLHKIWPGWWVILFLDLATGLSVATSTQIAEGLEAKLRTIGDFRMKGVKLSCFSAGVQTVNPEPVEVGSLSHSLQGFIHPRWLFGISSINSTAQISAVFLKFFFKGF